jgi:predicted PurR-regulated permease PerM
MKSPSEIQPVDEPTDQPVDQPVSQAVVQPIVQPALKPSLHQPGGLSRELTRVVLLIFALVSFWQLSHQLVEILLMFAMVFLLAVILNSVVVTLEKRGVRRGLAVGLIMLCFMGGVALGGWLIVPPALRQANQLVAKAPTYWKTIRSRVGQLEDSYPALKGLVPQFADEGSQGAQNSQQKTVQQSVQKSTVSSDENSASANEAPEESQTDESSTETQNAASEGASDESSNEVDAKADTKSESSAENAATSEAPVPPDITEGNSTSTDSTGEAEPDAKEGATKTDDKDTSVDKDTSATVTRRVTTRTVNRPQASGGQGAKEGQEAAPLEPLSGFLQQDALLGYAKRAVAITATLAGAVFVTVLSFLLLMFTLANPHALVGGILSVAPDEHREATRRSLARIFQQMTGWARATLINGTITGVLTGVGMAMVGVHPALVFGICAFFGEFVPNVGPLVAAVPAIFVAISMGPTKAAMALGVIIFVQAIASNALNPIIMGREMKLHPVSITFFALAMGKLFGVAGAILAVPTAAVSKILVEEFYLRPRGVNEGAIEEQARGIVMNEAGIDDN